MKKLVVFLIFAFTQCIYVHCESITNVFMAMPDSLFPLLTEKNRHDMIDFYNNHMEAKVRNQLNDYARLDTLTDSYIHLTLSKASTAEMKLLQTDDSMQVVALIQTVSAPAKDSRIRFFNTQWQQLYWLELPTASVHDFFAQPADSVAREMDFAQRSVDDIRLIEVAVSPSEPLFTLSIALDELEAEEKKLAHRYVRSLRYRWTGTEFIRE